MSSASVDKVSESPIIDIRNSKVEFSLEEEILKGMLYKPHGQKSMPTMLLYSAEGLKLFEEITYLDEYYLTNTEIEILEKYARDMAERVQNGTVIVELGSGNLRKVNILLRALENAGKSVDYYALDLDLGELQRTLAMVDTTHFRNVHFHGLHGTYDDGRAWLQTNPAIQDRPRCVLWLGSSVGNFSRVEAGDFLKSFASEALRPGTRDFMLIGLDGCKQPERVFKAYNDSEGVTDQFIKSGLKNANVVLGDKIFHLDDWEYVGEWNVEAGRHQAYYVPKRDIKFSGKLEGVEVKAGERVHIEYSYKFDDKDAELLWEDAGVVERAKWSSTTGDYALTMVQRPAFEFGTQPSTYAPEAVPSLKEWEELWKSWTTVTLGMIPQDKLLSKPIDLRNPCIFYLGHIPTFMDHLLNLASDGKEPATEPQYFLQIFQRGIDPDVDNPEQCHKHSEIPTTWPKLSQILDYADRVHRRLKNLYKNGSVDHLEPVVQRAIWTAFEHEAMHLETLLYMLLQADSTPPPPGSIIPDFVAGRAWETRNPPVNPEGCWHTIPSTNLNVGINDPEFTSTLLPAGHHFGWDNEKPRHTNVHVPSFKIRSHPITNGEYATYLATQLHSGTVEIPASWIKNKSESIYLNGDTTPILSSTPSGNPIITNYSIRTVYGPVPLPLALDWPAIASYNELAKCAEYMGGRIPTADQVRAVYDHVEKMEKPERTQQQKVSAVNGHLIHNGVCETPPATVETSNGRIPNLAARAVAEGEAIAENIKLGEKQAVEEESVLFTDLATKNIGFKKWHPTAVHNEVCTHRPLGRGEMGGAWEWTSTVLERYEGFVEGRLYPEYTSDFMDGKHNVVLGGSWATHPRIAGRRSFVNWYQRNYKFMWATARFVKD
ncbi:hypothetical protein EX30DRAFT_352885 [Ascodesmis nigricans]|uniref:Uncharacterized protein n=1 Tax=Ascodesmis nigricans TaxID=341454 RepID=A0A4S2N5U6_9PEZI|nr:hypothetical protein EX30DRAFT_352885 [Ascodesmis nigricans]